VASCSGTTKKGTPCRLEERREEVADDGNSCEPGRDYREIVPEEMKQTAVFRIDIEEWSGKEKFEAPAFEGASELPRMAIPFEPPSAAAPRGSSA
jgi:hypothetical protein